jgi:hypothetical protein
MDWMQVGLDKQARLGSGTKTSTAVPAHGILFVLGFEKRCRVTTLEFS